MTGTDRMASAASRERRLTEPRPPLPSPLRIGLSRVVPELKMFCRSSGGLASLAVDRGLLVEGDFPDVDSFPRELVVGLHR